MTNEFQSRNEKLASGRRRLFGFRGSLFRSAPAMQYSLFSRNLQAAEKINKRAFLCVDGGIFAGHFDEPRLTILIQNGGKDALFPLLLIDWPVAHQINHQVIVSVRLDALGGLGERVLIDRGEL